MLMEDSILQSTKKILGIDGSMDAFDADVLTCINSAFSVLSQLGIFEEAGVAVEDERLTWADLELPVAWIQQIRTYVFLKTQILFDPPTTGFLLTARKGQIEEHEWRISMLREYSIREEEEEVELDV